MKRILIYIAQILIDVVPQRLLDEPERFMLAFVLTTIGFDIVFFGAPGSELGEISEASLLNFEIGICFLSGGILKIIGLWLNRIWSQRLGAALIVMGCAGFLLGVWLHLGLDDAPLAVVYIVIGITYSLRLLSSTATRWKLHKRGRGDNSAIS